MKAELWLNGGGITLTEVDPLIHSMVIQFRVAGMHTKGFDTSKTDELMKNIAGKIVSAINQARENAIAEFFEGDHGGEG